MATKQAVSTLTETLPVRLRNFFARYPPQFYSAAAIPKPAPPADTTTLSAAPSPYTSSRTSKPSKLASNAKNTFSFTDSLLRSNPDHPNPFLPYKNPETGRWRGAVVSLRRQNDLVKLARAHGVEELLPPGRKSTEYRETKVIEKGLRIKGTGVGQKVKGHRWERTMKGRLEERKKAMLEMPEMINLWKQRGHGRGWKKYPRQ
ncbi:54S ribosomal protein L25, mitochondrial [Emydomyces testavorans]|uniref:54S ribosomal protein L25, mitochondrial n=1 Tax=Emydomyces testavorans TaxID=2070801 RepID=A0AAF0DIN5_9EURO|nr:54S ribosomal protein L25, mitochondrial [Emydomyces testavorans]